jgi:hypothetical protein
MKERYDGRSKVIGCEKLHIRAYYDQIISSPTLKAFDSLEEEYRYHIDIFKI